MTWRETKEVLMASMTNWSAGNSESMRGRKAPRT
jgi:hypothetical protein